MVSFYLILQWKCFRYVIILQTTVKKQVTQFLTKESWPLTERWASALPSFTACFISLSFILFLQCILSLFTLLLEFHVVKNTNMNTGK